MATGITPDLTDVEKMMAADGVKFSGFTSESLATRAKRLDEFQPQNMSNLVWGCATIQHRRNQRPFSGSDRISDFAPIGTFLAGK